MVGSGADRVLGRRVYVRRAVMGYGDGGRLGGRGGKIESVGTGDKGAEEEATGVGVGGDVGNVEDSKSKEWVS